MDRLPVLFSCSHRRSGNSDWACELFLQGIRSAGGDAKIIHLGQYDFVPCHACGKCRTSREHRCVHIKKDEAQSFYQMMLDAPFTFFSSPIYFYHLPSRFKTFIDRGQWAWEAFNAGHPIISDLVQRNAYCCMIAGRPTGEKLFQGAELTLKVFLKFFRIKLNTPILFKGIDEAGDLGADNYKSDKIFKSGHLAWSTHLENHS